MLYILYGGDDFSLREALAEIRAGLGDESMAGANTTLLHGQSTTPEELIATCDTVPFLAPKRLVIVEGLLSLLEQQGRAKRPRTNKDSGWLALTDYVAMMPESTVLVLIDGKVKRSNPLLKGLSRHGTVREFSPLKGAQLGAWLRGRVEKCGGDITPEAVRLLADLGGGNLWLLSNEVQKLCLYALGRTVEEDDVRLLAVDAHESSVFAMTDAILERRLSTATRLLHGLEAEGAAAPYLLYMITRQFRLVIQARELLQQRRKLDDIGRTLGIASEFALRKTVQQARGHSMRRLEEVYRELLDTDIAIKTGRFKGDKGELALELLVSELCAERPD